MRISKLEKEILERALNNQTIERRAAPYWRAAIKCPLPGPAQEAGREPVNSWLYENPQNAIRPEEFFQQLKESFGDAIVPGRTNTISPETFMILGYLFAAGKVLWSRAEAESLIKEWQDIAPHLGYFVLPEFEPYADLFAAEILGGIPNVVHRGRPIVVHPDANSKEMERYEKAAEGLETKGLVVRVEGWNVTRKWVGVNTTKAGARVVTDLQAKESETGTPEPEDNLPLVRCEHCRETFLSVTDTFKADATPTGGMFRLLPKYEKQGWELWPSGSEGSALICPGCGGPLVNPSSGFLFEGSVIEPVAA